MRNENHFVPTIQGCILIKIDSWKINKCFLYNLWDLTTEDEDNDGNVHEGRKMGAGKHFLISVFFEV